MAITPGEVKRVRIVYEGPAIWRGRLFGWKYRSRGGTGWQYLRTDAGGIDSPLQGSITVEILEEAAQ